MDPASLKFAKTHEWVHLDGSIATIGISDFAVKELTDLVYIDLPEAGRTVAAGDVLGEVESVKAVSDLYAPLAGEVMEVNEGLADDLAALSEDPFGAGWIVKMQVSDPGAAEGLMDHAAYVKFCESETH
jgi:glycine cleavage system H protein